MTTVLFERAPFDGRFARGRLELRPDAPRLVSSRAFDWPGILLEAGRNYIRAVDDVALAHHYIGLNASDATAVLRGVNAPHGERDVALPPGSIWMVPAGDPVTLRVDTRFRCVRMTIDPRLVTRLLGHAGADDADPSGGLELRRVYGVRSPQLTHLLMTLVAEADAGAPTGTAFVDTLAIAVSQQLALHAGVRRARPEPARGGLSPGARRRVLELIDARLDARLSIESLAREVGLSPAHFSRAFKQTIGAPPHQFLMARRLERARRMLDAPGAQLSDVALRAGFSDQSHFTRHFKRWFGVTPGTLARGTRRCA